MSNPQGKPAPAKEFDEQALLRAAHEAAKHAYAPYSRFTVGAAILLDDGRVFSGCNVENISYGLTNCAERTAIFSAVANSHPSPAAADSEWGTRPIHLRAVAVVNGSGKECSPCGACRQVMAEFATAETVVIYKFAGGTKKMLMRELLPDGFEF
jgi:homotetrameric cytidine deaminase